MKFMILMIPRVYSGNKRLNGFTPDPEKMEEMDDHELQFGRCQQ